MSRSLLVLSLLCCIIVLAACNSPSAEAISTVVPTSTPPSSPTAAVEPTDTPPPTATAASTPRPTHTPAPTALPTIALGKVQSFPRGGFSVQPLVGLGTDAGADRITVFDDSHLNVISLIGLKQDATQQKPEEIASTFIDAIIKRTGGDYELSKPQDITIDSVKSTLFDVTGQMGDFPFRGQALVAIPGKQQYLFGFGMSNLSTDDQLWENVGGPAFVALIDSIEFVKAPASTPTTAPVATNSPCPISSSSTYGYSQNNPIQIGNDNAFLEGASRERAYLDTLRGPNGESLTYSRLGSTHGQDAILDIYQINGLSKPVTLYLDMYNFKTPQAPMSLTCVSAFPLTPP